MVFASSKYDYLQLLAAVKAACRPKIIVGCSSAGEFTSLAQGEGAASAVALRSSEMEFHEVRLSLNCITKAAWEICGHP
ncbi:MAG: FIST N-terminal domain-containing protein [Acidobacteriota bacterium]